MKLREHDTSVLEHIISYCDQIDDTVQHFGDDKNIFVENQIYRNAVALCILQIGELVSVLSEDFKGQYKKVPWKQIKDMRNIVTHRYGTFDPEMTWITVKKDVPDLKQYCEEILNSEE